uniref:Uncharacterized protein n=1 Tax=Rhizochromulina marina TaxID=1034831 RepID=A0A7S2SJ10_9STRA
MNAMTAALPLSRRLFRFIFAVAVAATADVFSAGQDTPWAGSLGPAPPAETVAPSQGHSRETTADLRRELVEYNMTRAWRAPWYQEPRQRFPPPNQINPPLGSRCDIPSSRNGGGLSHAHCTPVTVLLFGLTGREGFHGLCTRKGRYWQQEASKSQTRALFLPLAREGYDVRLFLATEACRDPGKKLRLPMEETDVQRRGHWDWGAMVRGFYSPFLPTVVVYNDDRCPCALTRLVRAVEAAGTERLSSGYVILSRPDLVWRPEEVLGVLGARPHVLELSRTIQSLHPRLEQGANQHRRLVVEREDRGQEPDHPASLEGQGQAASSARGLQVGRRQAGTTQPVMLDHEFHLPPTAPTEYRPPVPVADKRVTRGDLAPTLIFPFPCEYGPWQSYHCVADTMISLPGTIFQALQASCLGFHGCFGPPQIYDKGTCDSDPRLPLRRGGMPGWLVGGVLPHIPATSGHGCLLCLRGALDALLAQSGRNSSTILEGFFDVEPRHVNTRYVEGINPFYFMAGSDEVPTLLKQSAKSTVAHRVRQKPRRVPRSVVRGRSEGSQGEASGFQGKKAVQEKASPGVADEQQEKKSWRKKQETKPVQPAKQPPPPQQQQHHEEPKQPQQHEEKKPEKQHQQKQHQQSQHTVTLDQQQMLQQLLQQRQKQQLLLLEQQRKKQLEQIQQQKQKQQGQTSIPQPQGQLQMLKQQLQHAPTAPRSPRSTR